MKHILTYCPNPTDATSFYRGIGPLSSLRRDFKIDGEDIILAFTTKITWASVQPSDLVFFQRPFTSQHLMAARLVKAAFRSLWVDYDDDLFNVTKDNPTYEIYGNKVTQQNVAEIIAMADLVTVSTSALRDVYAPLNQNVVVIPNAIDDHFAQVRPEERKDHTGVVFWRGGPTHQRDLYSVTPQLHDIFTDERFKKWMIHFQGYCPWWLVEKIPGRGSYGKAIDIFEYHRMLHELQPEIMIVPLAKTGFNLCKSNIAYLEGCFAGATIIAPNFPEFQRPGVLNYETAEEFKEILAQAMQGRYDLKAISEAGWKHIKENETLSIRNRQRAEVLSQLFQKERQGTKAGVKNPHWMSHKTF